MEDMQDAIRAFNTLFEEHTGNKFTAKEFVKVPGRYTVMDLDYDGQVGVRQRLLRQNTNFVVISPATEIMPPP